MTNVIKSQYQKSLAVRGKLMGYVRGCIEQGCVVSPTGRNVHSPCRFKAGWFSTKDRVRRTIFLEEMKTAISKATKRLATDPDYLNHVVSLTRRERDTD